VRLEVIAGATALETPSRWIGAVLCHDVPGPGRRPALLKGHRLVRADDLTLETAGLAELHLLWLEEGDVDEDTAALRLARAVAGPGVELGRPVESQVRLSAAWRGLLRVDETALAGLNGVDGCTVFTLPDGMPVEAGRTLGAAKITPLAVPEEVLQTAEQAGVSKSGEATVRIVAFFPKRVAVLLRERLSEGERRRFDTALRRKLEWFGGELVAVRDHQTAPVDAAVVAAAAAGADVLLAIGVTSVDPLEETWRAVLQAGGREVRRGLPVHPGSSYWIADLAGCTVIGVASCGTFSRRTALDLLLVRIFSGEPLSGAFLAGLGHGGLLASEMAWRFPRYEGDAEEE
jgi:hypothetical protein